MSPPPLRNRLAATALGLLAAFLLLEVGLRLVGAGFGIVQTHQNREAASSGTATRVMCIGESVTALGGSASWPAQLETVLAERTSPGRYRVVNTAIPGSWSEQTVDRVARDLPTFRPDWVVALIGANDYGIPLADPLLGRATGFLWDRCRTCRLFTMASFQLAHPERGATTDDGRPDELGWYEARLAETPDDSSTWFHFGRLLFAADRYDEAAEAFHECLRVLPESADCSFLIGLCAERLGRPGDADRWYQQALSAARSAGGLRGPIKVADGGAADLADLARIFQQRSSGDLELAMVAAEVAVARAPADPRAWTVLAETAEDAGELARAQAAWRRVGEIQPTSPRPWIALSRILAPTDAEGASQALETALALAPEDPSALSTLARNHLAGGRHAEAEGTIRRALARDRTVEALLVLAEIQEGRGLLADAEHLLQEACDKATDCAALEALVGFLAARGRRAEARAMLARYAHTLRNGEVRSCHEVLQRLASEGDFYGHATPRLRDSYARLYDLLHRQGVGLVAVQYPTLPVEPLKRVLPDDASIVVVDNEAVFKAAVRREGYAALFTDRGYGTFGHGTALANRLIAERVAEAILKAEGTSGGPP